MGFESKGRKEVVFYLCQDDKRGIRKGFEREKEKGFLFIITWEILGGNPKGMQGGTKGDERDYEGLGGSCYRIVHSKLNSKLTHKHEHLPQSFK
jgi:hypothetical protein